MLRSRPPKRVFAFLALIAACVGFGALYQNMDEEDRLTTKRLVLVCGAPLSLAAILTAAILAASRKR